MVPQVLYQVGGKVCASEGWHGWKYARVGIRKYGSRVCFAAVAECILTFETQGGSEMRLPYLLGKQLRGII
jgi:hypothetical protein